LRRGGERSHSKNKDRDSSFNLHGDIKRASNTHKVGTKKLFLLCLWENKKNELNWRVGVGLQTPRKQGHKLFL